MAQATKYTNGSANGNFPLLCDEKGIDHNYISREDGEFCTNCGDEKPIISTRPEWRAYDEGEKRKRARVGLGETLTIHDKGLTTTVGYDFFMDGKYTPERLLEIYKLRK